MIKTATETDAQSLCAEGWTLPSLASEGYQVESMVQGEIAGQPMVVITLVNDQHSVEIIEQRGEVNPNNPVDGATGLPVSAEGLHESAVEARSCGLSARNPGGRSWLEMTSCTRSRLTHPRPHCRVPLPL